MTTNKISIEALSLKGDNDSLIVICFDNKNNCDIEFSDCNRMSLDVLKEIIARAEAFIDFCDESK